MFRTYFLAIFFMAFSVNLFAQENGLNKTDSLKQQILRMDQDLYQVQMNLHQSKKTLKYGILVATLGYSVTIAGGQLLGTNPQLGEALLYTGGAIGIAGTVVLVHGFNKISLEPPKRPYPSSDR